jgi:acetylglutamate kinase
MRAKQIMKISKQTYIIKIGGELISNLEILSSLCKEIARLKHAGTNVVLVHGGGQQISEMETKLGKTSNIINGRRVTDESSLEIIKMVISGKINIEILSALQCNGVSAVGLSGVDGHILNVHRRPPKKIVNKNSQAYQIIDYGFVGDILTVNPELLLTLIENNFLPVIAPLAADKQGIIYNINADTVASSIALSLNAVQAVQWIILTNIDGVYDQKGNTLSFLTCKKARELIEEGAITNGMVPKIESILSAIQAGIKSVHIMNGLKLEKLQNLFLEKSLGTLK